MNHEADFPRTDAKKRSTRSRRMIVAASGMLALAMGPVACADESAPVASTTTTEVSVESPIENELEFKGLAVGDQIDFHDDLVRIDTNLIDVVSESGVVTGLGVIEVNSPLVQESGNRLVFYDETGKDYHLSLDADTQEGAITSAQTGVNISSDSLSADFTTARVVSLTNQGITAEYPEQVEVDVFDMARAPVGMIVSAENQ